MFKHGELYTSVAIASITPCFPQTGYCSRSMKTSPDLTPISFHHKYGRMNFRLGDPGQKLVRDPLAFDRELS